MTPPYGKAQQRLQGIQQHGQKLQHRADEDEDMEHRVHPLLAGPDTVKHRTDGIGDAAGEQ